MPRKTKAAKKKIEALSAELTESLKDLPPTLGACADEYYSIREKRLAIQRKIEEMEAREKVLKEHLIAQLPKSDANGITGRKCRVTVVVQKKPTVEDWDALYKHVKKTGEFEFFTRRVNESAVKERWEAGKKVPGVGVFQYVTLSINKL